MLRALIVDDEEPARNRLRRLLAPFEEDDRLEIIGEASDGIEAVEKLNSLDSNLVFLDIQMPGLDGFEVIERVAPGKRPVVIFITAYDMYALKAFEANAIDYLLKPISFKRLEEAVSRVEERFRLLPDAIRMNESRMAKLLDWIDAQAQIGPTSSTSQAGYLHQISIPLRDRILILPVNKLVTAEVQEGITRLNTVEEELIGPKTRLHSYMVNYTLDQLESNLDPEQFMRVHRSAIVQLTHIREMIPWFSGRYKLILTGNHEVVASRERSKLLKDKLMI